MTRAEQNAVARIQRAVPSASVALAGAFVAVVGTDAVFDMSFDLLRSAFAFAVAHGTLYTLA